MSSRSSSSRASIFNDEITILITYLISSEVKPSSFSNALIFCVNLPVNFCMVLNVICSSPFFDLSPISSSPISGISSPISSSPISGISPPISSIGGISPPSGGGIPISPISPPPSNGDGGNSGCGTAGGAGGGIGASPISSTGGFGVFNVYFFCSPNNEIPSGLS